VNDNADEMRRMYDTALRARGSVRAGAAVPLERILDLVEGRGGEEERLATLDAVMADEESAKEFELLRSLAANRPATRATWARRSYIVLCLAAAAAVLVVAAPVMRSAFNRPTESPARSGAQAAVPLLPPIEASQRTSRRFVWRPVAGARSYVVEVLTAARFYPDPVRLFQRRDGNDLDRIACGFGRAGLSLLQIAHLRFSVAPNSCVILPMSRSPRRQWGLSDGYVSGSKSSA